MSENKRRKRQFQVKKDEAELQIEDLKDRFPYLPVKEYMKQEYDFYGLGIRLGAQD